MYLLKYGQCGDVKVILVGQIINWSKLDRIFYISLFPVKNRSGIF